MKHMFSGMVIALALALVLVIGVVALAEGNALPELPEAGDLQAVPEAPEAQAPQQAQGEQEPVDSQDAQSEQDAAALQEALKALNEARQSTHQESLQAELDGYVEAGKLTQEQADVIMKYYQDQNALRNGTCPGCGYQFSDGQFKGGRGNGKGFGGNGNQNNKGFGGNGNRNYKSFGGNGNRSGKGFGRGGQSMNGGFQSQPATPDAQGETQPNAFSDGI